MCVAVYNCGKNIYTKTFSVQTHDRIKEIKRSLSYVDQFLQFFKKVSVKKIC